MNDTTSTPAVSPDPMNNHCPHDINDGGWGGPTNWCGIWMRGAGWGLKPGSVIERGRVNVTPDSMDQNLDYEGSYWKRIWDDEDGKWRELTKQELDMLPPPPRDLKGWREINQQAFERSFARAIRVRLSDDQPWRSLTEEEISCGYPQYGLPEGVRITWEPRWDRFSRKGADQ